MLKEKFREQKGFTFAEVIVATGIIGVVLLMFGLMLISSANLQKSIFSTQNVDRVLAQESEQINSMRWDNIMLTPATYAVCDIDGERFSNQSVNPGPTIFVRDGTEVSITRNVTWKNSETPVECTLTNKNKIEPKIITIVATWLENGEEKTKTLEIVRSKWAEAPSETISIPSGNNLALFYQDPLNNPSIWCQSYNGPNGLISGGTATPNTSSALNLIFSSNDAICGIELQGLSIGEIYTVVAEFSVPENSSAVTLTTNNSLQGTGLALANRGVTRLSHSFVATNSSEIVGLKIPGHIDYLAGSTVILTEFKILN
jgi:prepilin-type N-terminal cleavage/methylation domain-containing protein